MTIKETISQNISNMVNIVVLTGSLSAMFLWADVNLANKADIVGANKLSEFRSIEIHLSLNDYRLSEIAKAVDASEDKTMNMETTRVYDQLKENSKRLSARRDVLISEGVTNDD